MAISSSTFGVPNAFLAVLAALVVLSLIMRFTRYGRDVYATGSSERAAIMSGLRATRFRMISLAVRMGT